MILKDFVSAFQKTSPVLNSILVLSIILLVASNLIENSGVLAYVQVSSVFPGANQIFVSLWEIFKRICFAIPASYTFFFVSNRIPEQARRKKINAAINPRLRSLVGSSRGLLEDFLSVPNSQKGQALEYLLPRIDRREFISELNKLDLSTSSPRVSAGQPGAWVYANWFEIIAREKIKSTQEVEKILRLTSFLDADLILYLTKIDSSNFFKTVDALIGIGFLKNAKPVSGLGEIFMDYLELCAEIEPYIQMSDG